MDFTFSTGQIIAIASGFVVLDTAIRAAVNWIQRLTKPGKQREAKIKELDTEIKEIKEGNKVIQQALLALLEAGINGDNIDGLKEAKNALNEYLISK